MLVNAISADMLVPVLALRVASFLCYFVFFFKQMAVYEMRITDWSSDVCSSDLQRRDRAKGEARQRAEHEQREQDHGDRSDERRGGTECDSPCRSRWSPYH